MRFADINIGGDKTLLVLIKKNEDRFHVVSGGVYIRIKYIRNLH